MAESGRGRAGGDGLGGTGGGAGGLDRGCSSSGGECSASGGGGKWGVSGRAPSLDDASSEPLLSWCLNHSIFLVSISPGCCTCPPYHR